jgi:hypothetical protein
MTDYNVRDVFFLFTGRCGHKWVGAYPDKCPTCGLWDEDHALAEPITMHFSPYARDRVQRRIQRAIRENRRKPRKTATVLSLDAYRPQPDA